MKQVSIGKKRSHNLVDNKTLHHLKWCVSSCGYFEEQWWKGVGLPHFAVRFI
jgi:hypothetical protein